MSSIRVLIADDHRLFRQGLRQLCEDRKGFDVIGEATNGQEALELARRLKPDVVLMDIQMPELDGVQATRLILEHDPSARVIMLTALQQDTHIFDAIKAGARGYMLKDADVDELLEGIEAVHRGEALISARLAARVLDEFRRLSQPPDAPGEMEDLTPGEMDVLLLVAQGEDNKTIAERLALAEKTVSNRLSDVYSKLNVDNRTQAALYALRRGWARLDQEE
jgi:DNA-binding NarL/FixJ family response regulator